MNSSETIMVILLFVGILAKSSLISTSACIILILKFTHLNFIFPFLEQHGLQIGLLFMLLSILVPLANGKISNRDIIYNATSLPGIMAIIGGTLATHLNSQGLKLMQVNPEIIFGLVIGSIIGILFFNGQPVGPLMAAGVAALFTEVFKLFQ